ncbi:hypothetical protein [Micromonospora sp. NPDC005173]|uniref:hypothetical protein n=1 Tax=Micromonospora sp. NPDC005173 TaxID=3157165 RepID=UPI0033A3AB70
MKAHRTDLVSFAFGLVFLALSAWWLLAQLLGLALPPVGWFLAGALILIGVFGLVGALRSGRPARPEPTDQAVATEPIAPVSGATAPVSGAAAPLSGAIAPVSGAASTSGAGLAAWDAEHSTWDAPGPGPASEATTEVRVPEAPTADVIHPAWLAHSPSEPETAPISGQPADENDGPTTGSLARPAAVEADEPTLVDYPVERVDDHPADEREGQRRES